MTREEEIRNAIDTIIPIKSSENGRTYEQALMATGFEAGVSWADKHPTNVWHDANEKPRTKEWLLVHFDEDDYDTIYLYIDIWCDWCKTFNVIQWAYISEMLPKGCEK